jgi:hypothetical protein
MEPEEREKKGHNKIWRKNRRKGRRVAKESGAGKEKVWAVGVS